MRRRLDIPPLPFLQPDGRMYHMDGEGNFIPYSDETHSDFGDGEGQEMAPMHSNLSATQDYVGRARYLVGMQSRDADPSTMSAIDSRRAIAKLERATTELQQGIQSSCCTGFLKVLPLTATQMTRMLIARGKRKCRITRTAESWSAEELLQEHKVS